VRVTPQQANNLALVINELTTNTVKYALSEKQTVSIAIRIAREGSLILFEFRNSGPDYPPQVLSLERHNVGIYLMQTIVRKGLRGDLTLRNDGGAVALIRFPALIEESVGSLSSHER
jgi:two-component sensor histidine kinase